jgi:hypothetical protein
MPLTSLPGNNRIFWLKGSQIITCKYCFPQKVAYNSGNIMLCVIMAPFKTIFFISLMCFVVTVQGQTKQKLSAKMDSLKAVLLRADTLSLFNQTVDNIFDTISMVNEQIAKRLVDILTDNEILSTNVDSLLELPSLGKVHSKDKRLWIFNWYENTGGSWKSNISLVHYRTQAKKPKVDYVPANENEEQSEETINPNEFCSNGAWFDKIYKLKTKSKDLYLCIGSGVSCNTCIYQIATVVELTKDSINFNYPAFRIKSGEDSPPGSENEACFTLDARMGDIESFGFDPKTQTLTFAYLTDDHTPVQTVKQKRIVERLVFDGVKFVGKRYK